MTDSEHDFPILVTGAAGAVGAIGRTVAEILLTKGHKVRAMVRRDDARAESLRRLGAEVIMGDLTDLDSVHRAVEGCRRIYFGMSVSDAYLQATVNTATVALHHGVEVFVNMSQMTVSEMNITMTTDSPQHKLHWLAEQALSWSGLPLVTMRPTVFMEGFFHKTVAAGICNNDALVLPLGNGRTAPICAVDVARAVALVLHEPAEHIGRIYNLTGPESAELTRFALTYSEVLGRTITYRDVPVDAWTAKLREIGLPEHLLAHLAAMARLHQQGRYDRMTDDFVRLTGREPTSLREFVQTHAADFTRSTAPR